MIIVSPQPTDFSDWHSLLQLLRDSFAFMHGRIDPPSSMNRLDYRALVEKAGDDQLILATEVIQEKTTLIGCLFASHQPDCLYVGKIAVKQQYRGRGIARRLVDEASQLALAKGVNTLELQVRVELTENQAAFAHLGFVKTGESAHAGYNRPTSITMQKHL